MQNNLTIVLCGESGSGKTTLAELIEKELGFKNIQSFTTRKPRYEGETGHIFTTVKQYECNKANRFTVSETFFDGNYYWATKEQFKGKTVYVVDPAGIKYLKENANWKVIVIYLKSEQATRWNRMCWRKHKDTNVADIDILERLKHDKEVFKIVNCDYAIDADRGIEEVYTDVKSIIDSLK